LKIILYFYTSNVCKSIELWLTSSLFVAVSGVTVAVNVLDTPVNIVVFCSDSVTPSPIWETFTFNTVSTPESFEIQCKYTVPAPFAVNTPALVQVATL
jgi:hypothetical protein